MILTDNAIEACRQCTLKHLATALVCLTDEDSPDILRRMYFCGNLAHAANHFLHVDEKISEDIRQLRLDAQNDELQFTLDPTIIKERLAAVTSAVTAYTPPPPPPPKPHKADPEPTPVIKRGCPCHNR